MKRLTLAVAATALCLLTGPGSAPILDAADAGPFPILQSELQRNFQILSKEPESPAYFMSYTLHDTRSAVIQASVGALERSDESHNRFATVEVRVGDYTLDNTHPIRGDTRAAGPRVSQVAVPLTDEEKPIRLALWRATDRTFKQASEALTRVRTNVAAKVKEERPANDFSREEAQQYTGEPVSLAVDTATWEERLRRISAPFADEPLIFRSDVSLSVEAGNRYYVNSEGSQVATGDVAWRLFIQAVTKADDGMELPLYTSYFATSPEGLPDEKQLLAEVERMIGLLSRLRTAPLVDPYSGPAILSGRAAGVFFHEIFGHRIEANRQRNADDGQTFTGRVGQPVLPPFLSVIFDPTLKKTGDTELMGHYLYDDQGVKARRVTVVDGGILRSFLVDRAPVRDFDRSNGHGRAQPGFLPVSRQSNMIVESSRKVSNDELLDMLREEARRQGKPFGLLFDNIEGGFTNTGRGAANAFNVLPNVVYKVYADKSREPELVRGVDLIGTPLSAFGKIVATGDTVDIFNGVCGAESGGVPVSASAPPLLVSEVEVQKKSQSQETLPILPAPGSNRRS
jgi:predicted Zn-dependent protease